MRKSSIILAIAMILSTFGASAQLISTGTKSGTATSGAISAADALTVSRSVAKSWQDAYNREDATSLQKMYTANVTMVQADGSSKVVTSVEVKGNLEDDFLVHDEKVEINVGNATPLSDTKIRVVGTLTTVETDKKTGELIKATAMFDNLLVKDAGTWKVTQVEVIPVQ